jgi:sulfate/thiosulfate transport system permease protein
MIVRETTLPVKNVKANSEPGLIKKWILITIALGFLGIFILVP